MSIMEGLTQIGQFSFQNHIEANKNLLHFLFQRQSEERTVLLPLYV